MSSKIGISIAILLALSPMTSAHSNENLPAEIESSATGRIEVAGFEESLVYTGGVFCSLGQGNGFVVPDSCTKRTIHSPKAEKIAFDKAVKVCAERGYKSYDNYRFYEPDQYDTGRTQAVATSPARYEMRDGRLVTISEANEVIARVYLMKVTVAITCYRDGAGFNLFKTNIHINQNSAADVEPTLDLTPLL